MTNARRLFTVVLTFTAAASMAQERDVRVDVLIKGEPVMGFVPAENRAGSNQRGVCSEVDETGVKTRDGVPIRGFELTGWKEGDGYRVLVFAIVPTQEPGSKGLCSDGTGFKRVEFGDLHVKPGQKVTVPKMKDAGMTPWVLRVGGREGIFPQPGAYEEPPDKPLQSTSGIGARAAPKQR